MTKERTLAVHLEALKPVEKGLIVWALNATNHLGYAVHQGMLPFITVDDALTVLTIYGGSTQHGKHISANIRSELRGAYGISEAVSWSMKLDTKKVSRRFGAHPERGHTIPQVQKKRVTVGVKWSLPKKDHVPDDDVLVAPHVVLRPLYQKGWWEISCEKRYRNHVTTFLLDYCS